MSPGKINIQRVVADLERYRADDEFLVGEAVSEVTIQAAEGALACDFPTDYRLFVSSIGFVCVGQHEIAGLGSQDKHLDVVLVTLAERDQYAPRALADMLVIHNNGAGDLTCVDGRGRVGQPGGVVTYWHEDQEFEEIQPAFAPYLVDIMMGFLRNRAS